MIKTTSRKAWVAFCHFFCHKTIQLINNHMKEFKLFHHHHCFWPLLEHKPPKSSPCILLEHKPPKSSPCIRILGLPLKLSPGVTYPLYFSLQITVPSVSWAVSLSLSLWVPGQDFKCNTGHWLSDGVSSPSPVSLVDFIFCWLLSDPFPEFSVAEGLRPSDPKDSSNEGVDEYLDLIQCRSHRLHISALYSRTGSTVVLKILILMLMVRVGEAQMFFIWRKAAIALPILTFTPASVPPCLSTMLPR